MSKNILIFADGTGQAGGFRPDQMLSNVYKLYRATRSGPDSPIDPAKQVAFYDPGLGTTTDGGLVRLRAVDVLKAMAGSVAGVGISTNVADCYEAILKHYRSGDRIYLFGFSRGAYTARSVAGVLNLCGVPRRDASGGSLPSGGKALRAIAEEAVQRVYDHGAGKPRAEYEDEREELARRFRLKYGSGDDQVAFDHPYFIGLFDAVAALGLPAIPRMALTGAMLTILAGASWIVADLSNWLLAWDTTVAFWAVLGSSLAVILLQYLRSTFKWIRKFPQRKHWLPFHLARWRGEYYDQFLDPRINVVRHALSIDETRRDFTRVRWGRPADQPPQATGELERFQQYWFAGNHSDVGGSYPEDESRLSDIALNWIVGEATEALHPIHVDESKLRLYPAVDGPQHCQVQALRDSYPPVGAPVVAPKLASIAQRDPKERDFASFGTPAVPVDGSCPLRLRTAVSTRILAWPSGTLVLLQGNAFGRSPAYGDSSVIERVLDLSQNKLLIPLVVIMALAWALKALFGWHQWRGQNRKEFLDSWQRGDKQDDIWLEVVVRHLTGTYLPASIIRAISSVPAKVDSLLEIAQVWHLLQLDAITGDVVWRKAGHETHSRRRRRWWGLNMGYFVVAYIAAWFAMLAARLPPTIWLTWMCAVLAFTLGLLAFRCLMLGDALKDADKIAPRWIAYLNSIRPLPAPSAIFPARTRNRKPRVRDERVPVEATDR